MNKEELKAKIKEEAEVREITLPASWYNKSEENLRIMLDEIINDELDATEGPSKEPEIEVEYKEKTVSIADMKRENKSFLKQLQQEEYVDIEIDPNEMYPEGSTVPIGLNGVVFRVPVGIPFEKGVPKSIKEVYDYSKRETRKAKATLVKKLKGEIKIQ